ncbi:TetR/AcrR family transcriptional regulator [Brevundimonas sp.]|jgi:AcrR family transcriptional regulator|uniref:TetR/AcrR family transcriptional regulator n=1 Tax=Brevundimonas sp. TaxID=1871086 RepID=UPI0037832F66
MTANQTLSSSAPKVRGGHAERSAQMRQRLIDAAVACLRRVGYAATTTQLVMEEAGVSRGAMLHHFPTKVDLIIAVGEAAALHQNRYVRRRLADAPAGMERYLLLTRATWEAICEPPALALIEIMMASRSDPVLGARFLSIAEMLEAEQRDGVWNLAKELGVRDRETIDRMVRLHIGAMRGLAIEMIFNGDRAAAEASISLLESYTRKLTGELLTTRLNDARTGFERGL